MLGQKLYGFHMGVGLVIHENASRFGKHMEYLTAFWLREVLPRHIRVSLGNGKGPDIVLINAISGQLVNIEVKAARRGRDGKYRATIWKDGHADAWRHSDIVLFWNVVSGTMLAVPFIIPVSEIDTTFLCVSSNPMKYSGKWKAYRYNISVIMKAIGVENVATTSANRKAARNRANAISASQYGEFA